MTDPTHFVAFDLETTGLDSQVHEIIEIGAVRIHQGSVEEDFQSFVKPSGKIPPAITELTGIVDRDVEGAPYVGDVIGKFVDFLGDDPLIAHNAPFDSGFLKMHWAGAVTHQMYDSLELSQILLPRLINHRLTTLGEYFEIEVRKAHRALADARLTADVFLRLLTLIKKLPFESLVELSSSATKSGCPLADIFTYYRLYKTQRRVREKIPSHDGNLQLFMETENVIGEVTRPISQSRDTVPEKLDTVKVRGIFEKEGELEKKFEGYEVRSGQVAMATEVTNTFNRSEFLLYEGGTGIGKSLAYLIPSVLFSLLNGERIILSTNTKNLQEQLFYKDIPTVRHVLGTNFRTVLLKGRANYICLNKYNRIKNAKEHYITSKERRELLKLLVWVQETKTGDISENSGLKSTGLWSRLRSEPTTCVGRACPLRDECFVTRIRKEASTAHLLVVNHSLIFSDMASDNAILGPYGRIVFDEAHHLEKVAIQYLGRQLDVYRFQILLRQLYSGDRDGTGVLAILKDRMEKLSVLTEGAKPWLETVKNLQNRVNSLFTEVLQFFESLANILREQAALSIPYQTVRKRYKHDDSPLKSIQDKVGGILSGLAEIIRLLEELSTYLAGLKANTFEGLLEIRQELDGRREELITLGMDLQFLNDAEGKHVFWTEFGEKKDKNDVHGVRICSAPLDIAERMANGLYVKLNSAVFTSATLTTGGEFTYIIHRLGLDLMEPERVVCSSTPSPFNYAQQAKLIAPAFLPSPKEEGFESESIRFLGEFLTQVRKGTMVLFTSKNMLYRCYMELNDLLQEKGIPLYVQGIGGSRSSIMQQFKKESSSVLFGMDSFWEGVDIPGEALELLIITRLPFPVPTEPIIEAQVEELEKAGKNPFYHLMIPEAVIRFRQGFGRLIRSDYDRGVIFVMDNRIFKSNYGNYFLSSLPVELHVAQKKKRFFQEVLTWFEGEN